MVDLQTLVGNLTIAEFTYLMGRICGIIFIVLFCVFGFCYLFKFLFDLISYAIRKDKYKISDLSGIHVSRYVHLLRRSVMYAPTEKAYFIYYNRLIGAVQLALELGYYDNKMSVELLDVPNYNHAFDNEDTVE